MALSCSLLDDGIKWDKNKMLSDVDGAREAFQGLRCGRFACATSRAEPRLWKEALQLSLAQVTTWQGQAGKKQ